MTFRVEEDMDEQCEVVSSIFDRSEDIRARLHELPLREPDLIVGLARGSSRHALTMCTRALEEAYAAPVLMADISSSVRQRIRVGPRSLVIAVSQSGQTPDVVALAQASAAAGSTVITVSNEPGTLAGTGALHLPLHAGPERAIPATKTVAAQIAMLATVASVHTTGLGPAADMVRAVTAIMARTLRERLDTLVDSLISSPPLVAVGSGTGLGLAGEFAQKLQETCALRIMALDAAEFMHGPRAMLTPSDSLVAFDIGNRDVIDHVQEAVAEVGANVVRLGEPRTLPGCDRMHPGLLQALECLPALAEIQVVMVDMARRLGFDPDQAFGQSKITRTV